MQQKVGILLINIGSPEKLTISAIKSYLRKFLSDPKVITLPYVLRKILVNFLIVPFRAKQSLHAYQQVWTSLGSPLTVINNKLAQNLDSSLGNNYFVTCGMSYSKPYIKDALAEIVYTQKCSELIVIPLYPQYAIATNDSAIEEVNKFLSKNNVKIPVKIIDYFYDNQSYLGATASNISSQLSSISEFDHILFSYHGLPERQVTKLCDANSCNMQEQCPKISNSNKLCYRAQCFATTSAIIKYLDIPNLKHSTSFQSRLGRLPWIQPYTDVVLEQLRTKKVKNLVVVCPGFIIDCLETLEEIGMRAKERWQELGGNNFYLIPCLNENHNWLQAVIKNI